MRRRLMIECPQCEGGDSEFYYLHRQGTCSYCGGTKKVNIFDHHRNLDITDERHENVKSFVNDVRFLEYLEAKNK